MENMSNLQGKRLLLLGGYPLMRQIVNKAHELGVVTIATDWGEDAPAKYFADEFYNVSTTDVDALYKLANDIGIDGVYIGSVDVNLIPGAQLCERLGLPCYATEQQFRRTLDKSEFKKLCEKYMIPSVTTIEVGNSDTVSRVDSFPVIVKPVDSDSSKGITVCHRPEEFDNAVKKAIDMSSRGMYLVEPFVTGDDVYLYFTVQDGVVSLSAMADRFVNLNQAASGLAPQPMLYLFPSRYIGLFREQAQDAVQAMVTGEQIQNGSFMMQGFVHEGSIVFFEMGFRLTGGCGYIHIRNQNQIDQVEMHIRYALGDGFGPWKLEEYDCAEFPQPACVLVALLGPGVISEINGIEAIRNHPSYVDFLQLHSLGEEVTGQGTLRQVFARIYLTASNTDDLIEAISFVKTKLEVLDENGRSMLLPWFDDMDVINYYAERSEQ